MTGASVTGDEAGTPLHAMRVLDPAVLDTSRKTARRNARNAQWSTAAHAAFWAGFNLLYALNGAPPSTTPGFVLSIALIVSGLASWALLSEWMCGVAYGLRSMHVFVPSNTWIWLSWLIPIADLFSPARTMRRLSRGAVGRGLLLAWWLPWLLATGLVYARDTAADPAGPALVSAAAILVSWCALARILRQVASASATSSSVV